MSRSQYDNVFFYFRGPLSKAAPEAPAAQLEDNTTKALMNLLRHGGDGLVRSWLQMLDIPVSGAGGWETFLQRGPAGGAEFLSRHMVVISPAGEDEHLAPPREDDETLRGRVDAAVARCPGQLVIIESKVAAMLDAAQLERHAMDWNLTPRLAGAPLPADRRSVSWSQLFAWADVESRKEHPPVQRFLLEQFAEYLAIQGLAPIFVGFQLEDFEYLAHRRRALRSQRVPPTDALQNGLIRDRLTKLWGAVRSELTDEASGALGEIRYGTLRAAEDKLWAVTNAEAGLREVNLTLELSPSDLQLNLVGVSNSQARRFESLMHDEAGRSALAATADARVVAMKRRAHKSKSGTPFWMHTISTPLAQVQARTLADDPAIIETWKAECEPGWETLAYHLRVFWESSVVLDRREALACDVAAAVQSLVPLMRRANGLPPLAERDEETQRTNGSQRA